jgi:hypothetical protein
VADRIDEVEQKVDDIGIPKPASASSVLFITPLKEGEELSAESKKTNAVSYRKVVNGFAKNEFYDVKIFSLFMVVEATVISNPQVTHGVLKLMYEFDSKIIVLSVLADGSATLEETDNSSEDITIDSELSDTSENAVQNKVVKAYVDTEVSKKVDKVSGKGLSTEDFTTVLKTKLEGLKNYDDTTLTNAINSLTTQINTLVSGDASVAIESFNEIIAFLNGVEDSESLDSIIAAIEQQIAAKQDKLVSGTNIKTINGESILGEGNIVVNVDTSNLATKEELNAKQDKISDLETIRSGAAKGATALQKHQDISHLASKEELQNLQNEVIANEEVVASAFNDVNERINELAENVSGEAATKVELAESVATINETIAANDNRYDDEFSALDNRIDELAANVSGETVTKVEFEETITNLTNEILDNEEVVASAFNDVNVRINELAENVSGEAATKVELNDAVDTINQTIQTNDSRYAQEFSSLDTQIKQLAANVQGEAVTKTEFQETLSDLNNEILGNEEVVASAINDLNARIAALEDIITTLQNS